MKLFKKDPCPEYIAPEPPTFPRFCSRCGSALVPEVRPCGYDETTGEPFYTRWLRCPNWSGGRSKAVCLSPFYYVTAANLNATFTARKYRHCMDSDADYIDCLPAYELPVNPPDNAKPRRAVKK